MAFSVLAYADQSPVSKLVEKQQSTSPFELVKDWRILSALVLLLTSVFIAIAYAVSIGFEIPELKAWANVEFTQIIATALIILFIIATITLMDSVLLGIVNQVAADLKSDNMKCELGTKLCAITTADNYLTGLIDSANKDASDNLEKSVKDVKDANYRVGLSCNIFIDPIPCLWLGYSSGFGGGELMLESERFGVELEHYSNLLSSLTAQRFFVDQISFKVAPSILLIGIVARSFFVTRKLGGLLVAIGVGVMFVFPFMYFFDWLTLNVTLFGDSAFAQPSVGCPASCLKSTVIAYDKSSNTVFDNTKTLFNYMDSNKPAFEQTYNHDSDLIQKTIEGLKSGSLANDKTGSIASCEAQAYYNEKICSTKYFCNDEAYCKGKQDCDIKPKCYAPQDCSDGSTFCHSELTCTEKQYCPSICRELPYPTVAQCTDFATQKACSHLPAECKITRTVQIDQAKLTAVLGSCDPKCLVTPPLKSNCDVGNCLKSSMNCRFYKLNGSKLVNDNVNCEPDYLSCPKPDAKQTMTAADAYNSCVYVLPNIPSDEDLQEKCNSCVFVNSSYLYTPPINVDCVKLCSATGPTAKGVSAASFASKSKDGMVGYSDIQNVAKLLLPAYVLPLLNILVTVMFIKSVSEMLGGDIEIPGLQKVF